MDVRLRIADSASGVRTLTLDHPARRNALDDRLLEAIERAILPTELRVILFRATPPAFCGGYDVSQLPGPSETGELPDATLGRVLRALEHHPAATVALVDGPAFGAGCELACTCDFRVASPGAVFSMPPARLGVVYAPEGLSRITALVGRARAKQMFFTAARLDAAVSERWGLIDRLGADSAEAEALASRLCEEIAANAPLSVRGMKRAFSLLAKLPLDPHEDDELRALRRAAFESEDAQEGRAAFLEKRPPRFRGR